MPMDAMWKRITMIDHEIVGKKIVEWTLDPGTRPTTIEAFEKQLAGGLTVKDKTRTTKLNFIDTPYDTILIRLPPREIIQQAKDAYSATPPPSVDDYPFPAYYRVDPAKVKAAMITAEDLFYSSVGDYTTAECA